MTRRRHACGKVVGIRSTRKSTWTDYVVTSYESGQTYRVSLRGFEPGQSYCTCPDFRTNHLGTCKHVLHSQEKVRRKFTNRKLAQPYRRQNLSLRLDYGPQLGLRFNLPDELDRATAKTLGRFTSETTADVQAVMACLRKLQRAGQDIHVYPDAEEFLVLQHL